MCSETTHSYCWNNQTGFYECSCGHKEKFSKEMKQHIAELTKPCFGIGKRGSDEECRTCIVSEACYEEAEARAERSYMG